MDISIHDNKIISYSVHSQKLEAIYSEYEPLFLKMKNYGWLAVDFESKEDLIQKMKVKNIKAFRLTTSYGIDGWIWAESMIKMQKEII